MNHSKSEQGFALIWVNIVAAVLLTLLSSFFMVHADAIKQLTTYTSETQAFYLAEAGIDHMLYKLNSGDTSSIGTTTFGNGSYQVLYDADNRIAASTGTMGDVSRSVTVSVESGTSNIPPGVKAAASAPGTAFVVRCLNVDGREHDSSGSLTGEPGTYGLAYGDTPSFDGWILPQIGGNGVEPTQPVPDAAKHLLGEEEIADLGSAEAALGLPAGSTLLNPYKHTSPPSAALNNEIYYYTPSTSGSLLNPVANIDLAGGSGILIVSNTAKSSWVKLSGSFTGYIVCNNCIFSGSAEIVGAVTSIDPVVGDFYGAPLLGGDYAEIKYSSEVLQNLPPISGAPPRASGYRIKNWIDDRNEADRLTESEG